MSRGWLRTFAALSCVAIVMSFGIDPTAAEGNAGLHLHKTVDPLQLAISPGIAVTLAVDKSAAIPGDTLTYTSVVTNPTATFAMGGYINAEAVASGDATVAYYWDQLEVCGQGCGNGAPNPLWTPVATFEAGQSGYVPVTPPAVHTGMSFAAQSVIRPGVTYPTSGDPILGTVMNPKATATWTYLSKVVLTPAQVAVISDPAQVTGIRNVLHFEVTIRNSSAAQPYTDPEEFSNPFSTTSNPGAIRNITVTFTMPDGSTVAVGPAQVPALGTLSPGGSVTGTASYKVPVPAAKGAGETDSRYAMRLGGLDGSALTTTAVASGSGFSGNVYATAPAVTAIESVPIVTIVKFGPPEINAGDTETNPLSLNNGGGAPASSLLIVDSVPGGTNGAISGPPTVLPPGASASATATFPVPISQAEGDLTDTATVTWKDANGNAYGPLTSSFTTKVHNLLFSATLTLAPANAGPNPPGTTQTLTATLLDRSGNPIPSQLVRFDVTGANPGTGTASTNASGVAEFTYTGANAGNDVAQATVTAPGLTLHSNTASISWGRPVQPIVTTSVQGNFFPNPNNTCTFGAGPTSTPAFGQTFPDILFNPPPSSVPHNISSVNQSTRPSTDLTVDVNGNYNGQIVAQGNGMQAGNGSLSNFYAVFTGSFIATQAGDVTFTILHDDGYILGVGNGATRVNGDLEGNPPATTPFNNYGVVAGWNQSGTSTTGSATVHFPAPGTYPYELDYTECGGGPLFLVLETAQFIPQTDPLSIYVGYADGLRAGGSIFPFPWQGSPGVTFIGGCTFDAGALRFDNSGDTDITFDKVTVDIPGGAHFDLWPSNLIVPAHSILILTQTGCFNFDTSDYSNAGCGGNNNVLPLVNVTRAGVTTTYTDTHQILNTRGFDLACQGNESTPWQRIAGQANTINTPLPPGAVLDISPFTVAGALLGQTQALTVSAMDAAGNPVANLPVTLQVFGPNARTLTATTVSTGLAVFTYVGGASGTDHIQASAFIGGLRAISNLGSVTWSAPAGGGPNPSPNPDPNAPPPPSITAPSPADGTVVTKPVSVDATITPPSGQTITSWRVFYQALDPGPIVVIASGTTALPSPLATFDPTVLPNDTYGITVEATASNGAVQDLTTTVVVFGSLKVGRYTTTYQDLSVPVNGLRMDLRRTYDSIDKSSGDFGVGWRVSLANFRVASNRVLGGAGWTMFNKQCFIGLCTTGYKNSAPRSVTVVFPDGHTEVFDFTPQGGTNIFWECSPQFTARASTGTTSTLEPVDDTSCSYTGDGNLYGASGLYSPTRFRLTTHEGTVLILDRSLGLVSEQDRNGNTLRLDSAGLHSSTGNSITYVRDSSGRITRVTGPSGQTLTYTYSGSGDLATSTDPNGNQTTFTYDANHNLTAASGGAQPLQTLHYDSSGRLVSVTDALGNTVRIANDVAGRQETVTDPLGRLTTVYTMDDLGDVVRIDRVAGGATLTTSATYDAVGRPLSRTDPLGHVWTGAYDSNGNVLSLSPPSGSGIALTYDANGLPLTITDAAAHQTALAYDAGGNLVTFTDGVGAAQHLTYDAAGNRTSLTDALGNHSAFTFDGSGHNTSVTDALGHTTSFAYDSSGRLTGTTDALGHATAYTYDAVGHVTSIIDALGGRWTFTYNAQGHTASSTDPAGKTTTYAYDANQQLISVTDPLGHATTYAYDGDGRLSTRTDKAGGTSFFAYDGFGRLASETDPVGRATSYAYDGAGKLVAKTLANGGRYTYTYNADGRQTAVTDPLGRVTTAAYDAVGHLVTLTDPLGGVTHYSVDALGRTVSMTDPLGHTTTRAFDAAGNLTSSTNALGRTTTYTYDAAGNRTSTTNPVGATTRFAYDADNQLATITDALGRITSSTFDALGRLASVTLPSGAATNYTYDAVGRLTRSVNALGNTTTLTYDAGGNRLSSTDPNGNATRFTYDAAGRQTSMIDALGGTVTRTYDAGGQLTSVTNPRGDRTAFAYDSLGNIATQTDPAGHATTTTYDLAGEPTSQTDPRGIVVNFTYDAGGRLTRTAFPGGAVTFAYDAGGERTSMVDATGTTQFSYDAVGAVTSVAGPHGTVSYAYDGAGNRTSMSAPGRGSVGYAYDAAGQLTTLTDWLGGTFHFTYTPDGQTSTVSSPAGVTSTYTYDLADRLRAVDHSTASSTLAHYAYSLDANGNPTSVTSAAGTERYSLDALNRLTGVTYANGDSTSLTYDAAGNRLSRTDNGTLASYTYDSAGRLTAVGGTAFTYDSAGNLTSAGASAFTWDWADRLTSATVAGTTSTYTYDGDGLRVAAQSGATTTRYTWDRTVPIPNVIDDGSQAYVNAGQRGLEQSGTGAGSASYLLADGLGSVRNVTDATGAVTGSAAYDAFGSVRSRAGTGSIFGFTGEQTDPTGLVFLRARYYDPTVGRFLSPDSVQPNGPGTQGFNLYSYVANNPATNTDPTGHDFSYAILSRLTPAIILAGLAFAFRVALWASLVILLAVLLEPAVEEAVRDINKEAEDIYKKIMGEPKPKPKPCVDTECFPVPPVQPTPRSRDRCRAGEETVPALLARAESVRSVELGTPAYYLRAVADLRVRKFDDQSCLDIIGAGAEDLTKRQRNSVEGLTLPPAVWATLSDRHAEVTVLNEATKRGSPLALGVTITVCTEESKRSDTCRLDIANSGGIITPDQHGAYWPANNL